MASANEVLSAPLYVDSQDQDTYDTADIISPGSQAQPVYDFLPETNAPRCKCCPYGYHVDVGFVQYAEDAKRGKYLRHLQQIQRYKRQLRQQMEVFYKQHGRYPPMRNPPDLIRGSEVDSESTTRIGGGGTVEESSTADEDMFALFGTTERHARMKTDVPASPLVKASSEYFDRSKVLHGVLDVRGSDNRSVEISSSVSSIKEAPQRLVTAASSHSPLSVTAEQCEVCNRQLAMSQSGCAQCRHGTAEPSCEYCACYVCPQCNSSSVQSSLPTLVEGQAMETIKERLTTAREQMQRSLIRTRELEEQAKDIPVLEMRISVLREEKRLLEMQLQAKDQEKEELEGLYEESLHNISHLETLRHQEEADFSRRLVALQESVVLTEVPQVVQEAPRPAMVDKAVGGGDVRQLYFLQSYSQHTNYTGYDFDLPAEILSVLQSRWEASYRRAQVEETGVRRTVGVLASPTTRNVSVGGTEGALTAEACQFVDMDDEEWRMQESTFNDSGQEMAWYQEQIAASHEQRSIIQSLRRAYQFNSVEFKNMIIRLLAKSVRSQAVQVFPSVRHVGAYTNTISTKTVGVSEDSVDVTVRPVVQQYSIGIEVRAPTSNKMAFTDRVFHYDATTNTTCVQLSHIGTLTEQERRMMFAVTTQTDERRTREKSALTEPVDIIDRRLLRNTGINTEEVTQYNVGVWTDVAHSMDRSMGTEAASMYETAVATEPVRTSDKTVTVRMEVASGERSVISSELAESSSQKIEESVVHQETAASQVGSEDSTPEEMICEVWEEYSVMDMDGKIVGQQVTPVTSQRVSRSATSGGAAGGGMAGGGGGGFSASSALSAVTSSSAASGAGLSSSAMMTSSSAIRGTSSSISGAMTSSSAARGIGSSDSGAMMSSSTAREAASTASAGITSSSSSRGTASLSGAITSLSTAREIASSALAGRSTSASRGSASSMSSTNANRETASSASAAVMSSSSKVSSSEHRRSASTTRVERSRSGNEFAVTKAGSFEYGGGTVRPGQGSSQTNGSGDSTSWSYTSSSHARAGSNGGDASAEMSYARSRIPMSHSKGSSDGRSLSLEPEIDRPNFGELMNTAQQSASETGATSRSTRVDVKTTDLYAACKTLAQWMKDSTNTTSRQMNDAEANIKQAWFRLAGSRASRPEVVDSYLTAFQELGPAVAEKVVNMADDNGNTCVHYAVSQANWPMVSLLLQSCPVNIDRLNRTGYSPLMLAALCDMPVHDYPHLPKQLARASSNVDLASSSGAGQTALMLAASHGRVPIVEALMNVGASPNIQDNDGSTALMCASEHGHLEVVRALLSRPDTDATCSDAEGSTALSIAMENNHRDIALLIYARTNLGKASSSFRGRKPRRKTMQTLESATAFKYK